VILDIFSRYIVGWMLAHRESTELAKKLINETTQKQNIMLDQLTIHSDRGPSMTSHGVANLLGSLGVTKSRSRPHVSWRQSFRFFSDFSGICPAWGIF